MNKMVQIGSGMFNLDIVPLKIARNWARESKTHWFRHRLWFIKQLNDGHSGGAISFLGQNPMWPRQSH